MTDKEFKELNTGDIVRSRTGNPFAYVVTGNYGNRVTAVNSIDMTNPCEWELVFKNERLKLELEIHDRIVVNNNHGFRSGWKGTVSYFSITKDSCYVLFDNGEVDIMLKEDLIKIPR